VYAPVEVGDGEGGVRPSLDAHVTEGQSDHQPLLGRHEALRVQQGGYLCHAHSSRILWCLLGEEVHPIGDGFSIVADANVNQVELKAEEHHTAQHQQERLVLIL
jgi:hypothetical protein